MVDLRVFPPDTPGAFLNLASAVLLVLLGLWVARLPPGRAAQRAFGAFAAAFGLGFVLVNLGGALPDNALAVAGRLLHPVAGALVVALALVFPRPLPRAEVRGLAAPAVAVALAAAARVLAGTEDRFPFLERWTLLLLTSSFWLALLVLALRFGKARGPRRGRERGQVAMLSVALLMYPGLVAGASAFFGAQPPAPAAALAAALAAPLLVAGAWLMQAMRSDDAAAGTARKVALLALGLPLFAMAYALAGRWVEGLSNFYLTGGGRTLTVVVAAYAILRHQLLGIDVKVRWTVRQSTVAAAFVGVFFVVSESAATFFSGTDLGPYLGIAAAGLLVFAIAPLQRAAERVANAAMPGAKAPAAMTPDERLLAYREQARAAWADGAISRDERLLLDRLRTTLGIRLEDASRLESEAAREG